MWPPAGGVLAKGQAGFPGTLCPLVLGLVEQRCPESPISNLYCFGGKKITTKGCFPKTRPLPPARKRLLGLSCS